MSRRRIADIAVGAVLLALAWKAADLRLPQGLPGGVVVLGLVAGALNGLLAIGLVLIYRTARIINFAQGGLGAFSAVLAFELMAVSHWPWAVAVPLSILAAVAVSAGLEVAFVRRLFRAPRHIVTVATIGLAQILTFLELGLQPLFERYAPDVSAIGTRFPSPLGGRAFEVFPVLFQYDHVLVIVVVPVVLVALTLFLQRSWTGMAVRGIAENADRAGLLGVPAPRLSTATWAIAGLLSAVTAILKAPVAGFAAAGLAGPGLILRGLAAAAVGRMTSLPVTFAASLALGVVEQAVSFNYARTAPVDGFLLAVIVVAFLVRRGTVARAGWADATTWVASRAVRAIPDDVRSRPEVRRTIRAGTVALVAVAAVPPLFAGLDAVRLLAVIFVYAIVGVSLVVLTGWAGQISLGQWAVAGVGGFTASMLVRHSRFDVVVILFAAGAAAAIASVAVGAPALRIRGVFAGVTTLAFAIAAASWFFTFSFLDPGARVPRPALAGRIDVASERSFYYVVLATLLLVVVLARNLRASRVGRLLIATRDNEQAATSFGVSVALARVWAFGVAGFIAGLGGGAYVMLIQQAAPSDWAALTSLFMFAIVVIGGLGSIAGALAGAIYVQGAQYLLPQYASFLATGAGMLVLLIALPGGLSQLIYDARDRLLRRLVRT